jgi:RES domain-containing protein
LTVWRLARRALAALDGAGARLYGGRWNRPGQSVVYTAAHLSLALLEVMVHLELPVEWLPPDYVKIEIEIPGDLKVERIDTLPRSARAMLELGTRWCEARTSAVLLVPSIVVVEESNLLLNPAHPDFARIRGARPRPLHFDPRLLEPI